MHSYDIFMMSLFHSGQLILGSRVETVLLKELLFLALVDILHKSS